MDISSGHDEVTVTQDGAVLTIRLDAADRLNAVTTDMLGSLCEVVMAAAVDPDVRVLVLTGSGRAFSSGADLRGAGSPANECEPDISIIDAANRLASALTSIEKPVVCALNGLAAGVGVSIALAADLIVARDEAYFVLAFTRIGLMPDGGATALVAASLGRSRALQMALLADRLSAAEAAAVGLVWAVHDAEEFPGAVDDLARRLAAGPVAALGKTKAAINAATIGGLPGALELERAGQVELLAGPEFAEGVDAFLNRRDAVFDGAAQAQRARTGSAMDNRHHGL